MYRYRVFNNKKLILIMLIGLVFQLLYFYVTKITFECDGATYIRNAYFLQGMSDVGIHYRGPAYSVLIIFSGLTNILDTFYVLIFYQMMMSFLVFLMIYKLFKNYNKNLSYLLTLISVLSMQAFAFTKVILPQQLMMFCAIASIYFLICYFKKNKTKHMFFALFLGFSTWMTRGEGVLIPFILLIFIYVYEIINFRKIKRSIIGTLFLLIIFLMYSVPKAIILKDPGVVFQLSGWGSKQVFLQPYQLKGDFVVSFRKEFKGLYNNTLSEEQLNPNLVQLENGPYTQELYGYVLEHFSDINNYIHLKDKLVPSSLSTAESNADPEYDWWYELFERFEYDGEKIANYFFEKPNQLLFDNFWPKFEFKYGFEESDELFMNVAKEAFRKHPELYLIPFDKALWYVGVQLIPTMRNFYEGEYKIALRSWSFDNYLRAWYDGGNCGKLHLPPNCFNEYTKSHFRFDNAEEDGFIISQDGKRNWRYENMDIRDKILWYLEAYKNYFYVVLSIIFFISAILFIFFKNYIVTLPILMSVGSLISGVSIANDSMQKYEMTYFFYFVIYLGYVCVALINMYKKNKVNG